MTERLRRLLHNPRWMLALVAGLLALVVQSGELGTSDTAHRLQSTHAIWTAEPPVLPDEYPEFGIQGRDGRLQSWYGIGQSLLMLPADVAGTYLSRLPAFDGYSDDPSVRDIVVSYSTNIFICVLTAVVCFRFLLQLNFDNTEAMAGVLGMLFATTHLHYTQNMMENNYIFLLTLTGFSYQYEWLQTGSRRALRTGAAALGLNLLTRLTTGLDLIGVALFVLLVLWMEDPSRRSLWRRCRIYIAIVAPVYLFFGLLDRLYQFYRFGSFWNTYVAIIASEARQRNPGLPATFPFEKPFHEGFLGALFAPEKSIFLFDPLLILLIVLVSVTWRRIAPPARAYLLASGALLLAYISFYARYTVWSGDFAWGDRYVSTAVEFAVLLAVPLLLRHKPDLRRTAAGRAIWILGSAVIAASVVIQAASLVFWLPLEIYQMGTFGHPTFVIALRLKNIVAFALGKMDVWGLNTPQMAEDPWDYVHITCWNFLPFLLRRTGAAPAWVADLTLTLWSVAVAALAALLWRLKKIFSNSPRPALRTIESARR